jgi:hypothetical protein
MNYETWYKKFIREHGYPPSTKDAWNGAVDEAIELMAVFEGRIAYTEELEKLK